MSKKEMLKAAAILLIVFAIAALLAIWIGPQAEAADAEPDELEEFVLCRQREVHAAAELLRELGVPEDSDAIKALSDEWWRCENLKDASYAGTYRITGYDPYCSHCCGKSDGITASGQPAQTGYTVAMQGLKFGTKVYIEGLGIFEVQDRGVGPGVIDVACDEHEECYKITGARDVWVLTPGGAS